MKLILTLVLISLIACKPAPSKEVAPAAGVAVQKTFDENASYADHPANDLEVKAFLDQFHAMGKSEAMLIDLRTPPEFDDGYIPGAILINYLESDIDHQLGLLDKSRTYFIYCQQGARSTKCLDKMAALGFTKTYNLLGGYEAYLRSGLK